MKLLILLMILVNLSFASKTALDQFPGMKEMFLVDKLFNASEHGLTLEQLQKIQDVYTIGKNIKTSDGMTLERTLAGIMGQESSWGVEVLGDNYDSNGRLKSVYESSLGNFQIKLSTAKITIKMYPELMKKYGNMLYEGDSVYLEFEKNKIQLDKFKGIMTNPKWVNLSKKGDVKAKKTMAWATRNYNKHAIINNNLLANANKDKRLINKLLSDHKFGAEIAGHYLLYIYENFKNKGYSNLYKRSVGRYNGGINNMDYANKVLKRMELVAILIKKRTIS